MAAQTPDLYRGEFDISALLLLSKFCAYAKVHSARVQARCDEQETVVGTKDAAVDLASTALDLATDELSMAHEGLAHTRSRITAHEKLVAEAEDILHVLEKEDV